jgi:hypothetical protein
MEERLARALWRRARARPGTVAHQWPDTLDALARALGVDVGTAALVGVAPVPPPGAADQWAVALAVWAECPTARLRAVARRLRAGK